MHTIRFDVTIVVVQVGAVKIASFHPPYPLFESGPQSKEVFIKSGYELMLKRIL
jgi:hypothetical protein